MSKSKASSSKPVPEGPRILETNELRDYAIGEGDYHEAAYRLQYESRGDVYGAGVPQWSVVVGEHEYHDGRGRVFAKRDVGQNTSLVLPVMVSHF